MNLVLSNRSFANLAQCRLLQRYRYYFKSTTGFAVSFLEVEIPLKEGHRESNFASLLTWSSELSGSGQKLLQSHEKSSCKRLGGFTDTSEISLLSLRPSFKLFTLIFLSYQAFVISGRTSLRELLLTTRCSCTRNTRSKNPWTANKFLMVHLPTTWWQCSQKIPKTSDAIVKNTLRTHVLARTTRRRHNMYTVEQFFRVKKWFVRNSIKWNRPTLNCWFVL